MALFNEYSKGQVNSVYSPCAFSADKRPPRAYSHPNHQSIEMGLLREGNIPESFA